MNGIYSRIEMLKKYDKKYFKIMEKYIQQITYYENLFTGVIKITFAIKMLPWFDNIYFTKGCSFFDDTYGGTIRQHKSANLYTETAEIPLSIHQFFFCENPFTLLYRIVLSTENK